MTKVEVVIASDSVLSGWRHEKVPTGVPSGFRNKITSPEGLSITNGNIHPDGDFVSYPFSFTSPGSAAYSSRHGRFRALLRQRPNSAAFEPSGHRMFLDDVGPPSADLTQDLVDAVRAYVRIVSNGVWDVERFEVES